MVKEIFILLSIVYVDNAEPIIGTDIYYNKEACEYARSYKMTNLRDDTYNNLSYKCIDIIL